MMHFPGRFSILSSLAVAAVLFLQSSPAFASTKTALLPTWGCYWEVIVDEVIVGSGDVHGKATRRLAKSAALVAAAAWAEANVGKSDYSTAIGEPYEEKGFVLPAVEPEGAKKQNVTSSDHMDRSISMHFKKREDPLTRSSGSTFCEADAGL